MNTKMRHRNTHKEIYNNLSLLDKFAIFISNKIGTSGAFIIIITWSVLWVIWNLFAPSNLVFDTAPSFVIWLLVSNAIQLTLMPLLMVSSNIQSKAAEERAEYDLEVNIKAEKQIEEILKLLKI